MLRNILHFQILSNETVRVTKFVPIKKKNNKTHGKLKVFIEYQNGKQTVSKFISSMSKLENFKNMITYCAKDRCYTYQLFVKI